MVASAARTKKGRGLPGVGRAGHCPQEGLPWLVLLSLLESSSEYEPGPCLLLSSGEDK